jgi:hypothetical protein
MSDYESAVRNKADMENDQDRSSRAPRAFTPSAPASRRVPRGTDRATIRILITYASKIGARTSAY